MYNDLCEFVGQEGERKWEIERDWSGRDKKGGVGLITSLRGSGAAPGSATARGGGGRVCHWLGLTLIMLLSAGASITERI